MSSKLKVGIIGCGNISEAYFAGLKCYDFLEITACADLIAERAQTKATSHNVRAMSVEALLASSDLQIVINLTAPPTHAAINEQILCSGKHAYCEKPFALNMDEGRRVLALAKEKKLLIGCAPDTFFGSGLQTARHYIDAGRIGQPFSAMAFWLGRGHEAWHPAPDFYYQAGGGPMLDMGPYYITALVNFFGSVARVSGITRQTFAERLITSQPLAGGKIRVEVPTHYLALLEFTSGATANVIMSFDVFPVPLPRIVIYGTEGTVEVPDPNNFDGTVRLFHDRDGRVSNLAPVTHATGRSRGVGVADLARSVLRPERSVRASGELALHVLDVMTAVETSSVRGETVKLRTTCARPMALSTELAAHELDA